MLGEDLLVFWFGAAVGELGILADLGAEAAPLEPLFEFVKLVLESPARVRGIAETQKYTVEVPGLGVLESPGSSYVKHVADLSVPMLRHLASMGFRMGRGWLGPNNAYAGDIWPTLSRVRIPAPSLRNCPPGRPRSHDGRSHRRASCRCRRPLRAARRTRTVRPTCRPAARIPRRRLRRSPCRFRRHKFRLLGVQCRVSHRQWRRSEGASERTSEELSSGASRSSPGSVSDGVSGAVSASSSNRE
jgi:hypothetical protein